MSVFSPPPSIGISAFRDRLEGIAVTNSQAAAPALLATPALSLLGAAAEAAAQDALKLFQDSIQSLLDTPLDAARVLEWTTLRARAIA